MAKFTVEVARDATIRYRATVEANDLSEIQSQMRNHGYNGPIIGDWVEYCVDEFDDVEQYIVYEITEEDETPGNRIYDEDRR